MTEIAREGDILAGVAEEPVARQDGPPNPLIASDRVEGTAVFDRQGEKIGTVRRFLVEKRSGKAQYAEMEFGGFLGMGKEVYPLPWEMLEYDVDEGGYVVDLTADKLRDAPRYEGHEPRPIDPLIAAEIRGHYGLI